MDHLDKFVLEVRRFIRTIIIGSQRHCTDKNIAYTDLATAVTLPMVTGEPLHQRAAELILAAHQHVFPGDEQMIEHHQRLMPAELLIAYIERAAFQLAGIAGLSAVDVENSFRISRRNKAHRIVSIFFGHGDCRHNQYPMGIQSTRLMGLGTANDNAVFALFHHMNIQIRVGLHARRKTPISFGISHCAIDSPISLLHFSQEVFKPLMVFCTKFQVHFKGDAVYCVDGVHPYATLETG